MSTTCTGLYDDCRPASPLVSLSAEGYSNAGVFAAPSTSPDPSWYKSIGTLLMTYPAPDGVRHVSWSSSIPGYETLSMSCLAVRASTFGRYSPDIESHFVESDRHPNRRVRIKTELILPMNDIVFIPDQVTALCFDQAGTHGCTGQMRTAGFTDLTIFQRNIDGPSPFRAYLSTNNSLGIPCGESKLKKITWTGWEIVPSADGSPALIGSRKPVGCVWIADSADSIPQWTEIGELTNDVHLEVWLE